MAELVRYEIYYTETAIADIEEKAAYISQVFLDPALAMSWYTRVRDAIQEGGNPKFCVTAKNGANREKFIMGGRREKRLPPC